MNAGRKGGGHGAQGGGWDAEGMMDGGLRMVHRLRKQSADKAMLALPPRITERFEDCGGGVSQISLALPRLDKEAQWPVPAPALTPRPDGPMDPGM